MTNSNSTLQEMADYEAELAERSAEEDDVWEHTFEDRSCREGCCICEYEARRDAPFVAAARRAEMLDPDMFG